MWGFLHAAREVDERPSPPQDEAAVGGRCALALRPTRTAEQLAPISRSCVELHRSAAPSSRPQSSSSTVRPRKLARVPVPQRGHSANLRRPPIEEPKEVLGTSDVIKIGNFARPSSGTRMLKTPTPMSEVGRRSSSKGQSRRPRGFEGSQGGDDPRCLRGHDAELGEPSEKNTPQGKCKLLRQTGRGKVATPICERVTIGPMGAIEVDKAFQRELIENWEKELDKDQGPDPITVSRTMQYFTFLGSEDDAQTPVPNSDQYIREAFSNIGGLTVDKLEAEYQKSAPEFSMAQVMEMNKLQTARLKEVLRDFSRLSRPGNRVADVLHRPTFCRFLIDSQLIACEPGKGDLALGYHHAIRFFDSLVSRNVDSMQGEREGIPPNFATIDQCIAVISQVLGMADMPGQTAWTKFEVGMDAAQEIAQEQLQACNKLIEEALPKAKAFSGDDAYKQNHAQMYGNFGSPPKPFGGSINDWMRGLTSWLDTIIGHWTADQTSARIEMTFALKGYIRDMLIEPGCIQCVIQYGDLFRDLFSAYCDEDRVKYVESFEGLVGRRTTGHMSFAAFFRFCVDFAIIPHIGSFRDLWDAYIASDCIDELGTPQAPIVDAHTKAARRASALGHAISVVHSPSSGSSSPSSDHSHESERDRKLEEEVNAQGTRPRRTSLSLLRNSETAPAPATLGRQSVLAQAFPFQRRRSGTAPDLSIMADGTDSNQSKDSANGARTTGKGGPGPGAAPATPTSPANDTSAPAGKAPAQASGGKARGKGKKGEDSASPPGGKGKLKLAMALKAAAAFKGALDTKDPSLRIKIPQSFDWIRKSFASMTAAERKAYALLNAIQDCVVDRFNNVRGLFCPVAEDGTKKFIISGKELLRLLRRLHIVHSFADEVAIKDFLAVVDPGSEGMLDVMELEKAVDCVHRCQQARAQNPDLAADGALPASAISAANLHAKALRQTTKTGVMDLSLGEEARRLTEQIATLPNYKQYAFGAAAFTETLLRLTFQHMHGSGSPIQASVAGGLKALWLISFLHRRFDCITTALAEPPVPAPEDTRPSTSCSRDLSTLSTTASPASTRPGTRSAMRDPARPASAAHAGARRQWPVGGARIGQTEEVGPMTISLEPGVPLDTSAWLHKKSPATPQHSLAAAPREAQDQVLGTATYKSLQERLLESTPKLFDRLEPSVEGSSAEQQSVPQTSPAVSVKGGSRRSSQESSRISASMGDEGDQSERPTVRGAAEEAELVRKRMMSLAGQACETCGRIRDHKGLGTVFCHACSGVDEFPLSASILYPLLARMARHQAWLSQSTSVEADGSEDASQSNPSEA